MTPLHLTNASRRETCHWKMVGSVADKERARITLKPKLGRYSLSVRLWCQVITSRASLPNAIRYSVQRVTPRNLRVSSSVSSVKRSCHQYLVSELCFVVSHPAVASRFEGSSLQHPRRRCRGNCPWEHRSSHPIWGGNENNSKTGKGLMMEDRLVVTA